MHTPELSNCKLQIANCIHQNFRTKLIHVHFSKIWIVRKFSVQFIQPITCASYHSWSLKSSSLCLQSRELSLRMKRASNICKFGAMRALESTALTQLPTADSACLIKISQMLPASFPRQPQINRAFPGELTFR